MESRQSGLSLSSLALPAALTLLMLGWQGWHAYTSYGFGQQITKEFLETEGWRDRILELDQDRQHSGQMAVATGDGRWRERYDEETRALFDLIVAPAGRSDQPALSEALSRLQSAVEDLRNTETEIFRHLATGDRAAAETLVMSPAHIGQHAALIDTLDSYVREARRHSDELLIAERWSELWSLGVSVLILVSWLAVWMRLYLRLRQAHLLLLAENARRTQAEAGFRQAQKMEAVGRMANSIAHDFNNILSAILGFANLARSRLGDGHPSERPLMRIEDAVAQANEVVRGLLALSRNAPSHKVPTELGEVVSDTARLIRGLLPARIRLEIDVQPEQPVWVSGDKSQLQQLVLNLAVNSRDAIHGDGRILITARRIADTEGSADPVARLEVSDTGEGIPPEMAEHIFEPFFSTRPREQGSGLGLAIVHGIVTDHGGRIQVRSDPGQGTTMAIDLPAIDPPPEASAELTPPAVQESRSQGMILVADDHRQIREIIAESLETAGFEVVSAADGNELLRLLDRHRKEVRLLVIDYDLPARSGVECVRTVRRAEGAPLPIIMITGAAAEGLEDALAGEALLLRKPFAMVDLVRVARRMTAVSENRGAP